jgi:hypothetical protein
MLALLGYRARPSVGQHRALALVFALNSVATPHPSFGAAVDVDRSPAAARAEHSKEPMCRGHAATIVIPDATDETTRTEGTGERDVIVGGSGHDIIMTYGGDDLVCGGDGSDDIYPGPGSDIVYGERGRDSLHGGDGDDVLYFGPDTVTYEGPPEWEQYLGYGQIAHGDCYGESWQATGDPPDCSGDDAIYGSPGNEAISGGPGRDHIDLGPGDEDGAAGGSGRDTCVDVEWRQSCRPQEKSRGYSPRPRAM